MTAPTHPLTAAEMERALAAITSLAIVARSRPIAAVRDQVVRDRGEVASEFRAAGAPPRSLDVLLRVVDACAELGRAGDELEEALNESRRSAS
jgi:hypothetical protein